MMVLMLLFTFCGCNTAYVTESNNNDVQVEFSDDAVKEDADTNIELEQESTSPKESSILNITVDETATEEKLKKNTERMNRLFKD